ncbi:hypothetical protein GCM10009117_18310 [Gangjinia marincola]|uniref:Tryptophan-rich sensory protein n=1 Tax=Gangjinia marincola TaxID=578463 RepID=A0ABN1MI37_9FLAO
MIKRLAVLNTISVVLVIAVNYVSQALRLNNTTIGELSDQYDNLFTPASYAFAIWGLIFLSLLAYSIFQLKRAFGDSTPTDVIVQTEYWFMLANLLNCAWVFAFVYEYTGLSVLIMLGILVCLIQVIIKTNMERWDAPISIIAFVWWPICLYSGWIAVATIANVSAYLTKIGWDGFGLSDETWTLIMISVATLVNGFMIITRNMREFAMVGLWALVAIYVRHKADQEFIAYTALGGAVVLFIATGIHGYVNRHTNPFLKIKERVNR